MYICKKNKCTGCMACKNICPCDAIYIVENKEGFRYPRINKKKCKKCNLCKKICPQLNDNRRQSAKKCYAAISKNNNIYKTSTSGGFAFEIAKNYIENGNVVYASYIMDNLCLKMTRIISLEMLKKTQGSKYFQGEIDLSYSNIKNDLEANNKVLIIGTPCQIAGIKSYLRKEYINLVTIELICNGVPSRKFLLDEIKQKLNDTSKITDIKFRNNEHYYLNVNIDGKNTIIDNSFFIPLFINRVILRESCYNCNYCRIERVADITIGDFWGLNDEFSKDKKNGISLVIISSESGMKVFNEIKSSFHYEEKTINDAINANNKLINGMKKSKYTIIFRKIYKVIGIEKSYKILNFLKSIKKIWRIKWKNLGQKIQ